MCMDDQIFTRHRLAKASVALLQIVVVKAHGTLLIDLAGGDASYAVRAAARLTNAGQVHSLLPACLEYGGVFRNL